MGSVLAVVQIVLTVASIVYQRDKQKKLQAKMAEEAKDRAATKTVRVSGSNQAIPIIYGRTRMDGINVFTEVQNNFTSVTTPSDVTRIGTLGTFSGVKNEALILQCVIGLAPINKFITADIDGEACTLSKYDSWIQLNMNKDGGNPYYSIRPAGIYNDLAYTTEIYRMNRNDPQFNSKPVTTFYIEGRKVNTFDSNGNYITNNKIYSSNTVLVLLDYLLDDICGADIGIENIDIASFYQAYLIAEQVIRSNVEVKGKIYSAQSITNLDIKRHEFNGVVYTDVDHISNIEKILDSVPGAILLRSATGKMKLSLPDPTKTVTQASVGTIDDNVLLSDISFAQADTNEKLNKVKVNYIDSEKNFASESYSFEDVVYKADDLNLSLSTEYSMEGVTTLHHASCIGKALLNESRVPNYTFTIKPEGIIYEPGDVLRLFSERNDIDDYVRINRITMNSDFSLEVEAKQYYPGIYNYDLTLSSAYPLATPMDFTVEPPTNVTVSTVNNSSSLINSVKVSWTDADDIQVVDYIIDAGTLNTVSGQFDYTSIAIVPRGISEFLHNPNLVSTYVYRIRSRTRIGRLSDWSATSGQTTVVAADLTNNFSLVLTKDNIVVRKTATNTYVPTVDTSTLSFYYGLTRLNYKNVSGTLAPGEWTIYNKTGSVDNNIFVVQLDANDDAVISFTTTNDISPNSVIPLEIKYNNTSNTLMLEDATLITINKYIAVSQVNDGTIGQSAKYVVINGPQTFKYAPNASIPNPLTLTFSADLFGGLTTYNWQYWNGTQWTALVGTNDNQTYTLASNTFTWVDGDSLRVRCVSDEYYDEITVVKLYDGLVGANAISGFLTNEVHIVPAAANGTGYSLTTATGTFKIYEGTTEVTTSSLFSIIDGTDGGSTWTKTQNGLTLTINETTGVYSLSGSSWTSDAETFTLHALHAGVSLPKTFKITKSKVGETGPTGPAGAASRTVNLTAANQAITYNSSGTTPSPTSTVITASSTNTTGTVYYEFLLDSISQQNTTSNTLTYTPPSSFTSMPQTIVVNLRENSASGTILARDVLSLYGVKPGTNGTNGTNGQNAISGFLTNDTAVVSATSAGVVSSFAGTGGTFTVYDGEVEKTGVGVTYALVSATGLTTAINATTGVYTITGMSASDGNAIFSAVYNGVTLYRAYSISKALAGTNGATGSAGSRGAGWWRLTETATQATLDGYTSAQISAKFLAGIGLTAVEGDRLIISGTAPAVKAWIYTSGSWIAQAAFLDGNLLVNGTITADKVTVTNLSSLSSNLGAVTAGSININNKFTVDSAGNTNIKSATTGERLEMTNSTIRVYDTAGVVRVKIGNLA
jgi:hypothetical protein